MAENESRKTATHAVPEKKGATSAGNPRLGTGSGGGSGTGTGTGSGTSGNTGSSGGGKK
jgi:hypothetical protein